MDLEKIRKKSVGASTKYGANYWVCYQPKDDPFTHIRYFVTLEDAEEFFEIVYRFYLESDTPVYINLRDLNAQGGGMLVKIDNRNC